MSEKAEKLAGEPKPKKLDLGEKRVGMVDGAPWWTNFHVMFKGKLKNGRPLDVSKPEKMKQVYDEATKKVKLEPLDFVEFKQGKQFELAVLKTTFEAQVLMQKTYFDYCTEKNYALFAGNEAKHIFGPSTLSKYHYVVAKNGDEIVGIVMPCRE